jgi:DNA-directed RNA polymerase specialized sigma subunit, sigma24 homolog
MQEAFLRFLRTAPPDMEGPAMQGYLYRTADSLLIDHWRREKRTKRWSLEMIFRTDQTPHRGASDDMSEAFRELKPQQRSYYGWPMWKDLIIARLPRPPE